MRLRPETELDRARRHVREGEERLARQTVTLAEMQIGHDAELAALGSRLLENMQTSLDLQKRHLREIEGRSKR
jgi:hypothetical protein